ncbi:hypothetical protein YB2330_003992 [Saitoella coloradoensis]
MPNAKDTMQALRWHAAKDLRIDTIPRPKDPGANEVQVAPEWCGICGSDLHEYLVGPVLAPAPGKPHPLTGEEPPLTFGHEFAGRIKSVGSSVTDLQVGQKVFIDPVIADKSCYMCTQRSAPNACEQLGFMGLSGAGGGLSEAVNVPADRVYPLPDEIDTDVGALIEPISVAWHAVALSGFQPGQDALILGAGPIGLATLLSLKAHKRSAGGQGRILVSEVSNSRKAMAKSFGADNVLDPTQTDVIAECKKICDGVGPHVTFDCSGLQVTAQTAIRAVRSGGTAMNIAIWETEVHFNPNELLLAEKRYLGAICYTPKDIREVIEAMRNGRIEIEEARKMITKKVALKDGVKGGFEELVANKDKHIKILIGTGN